jgi:uncharacterized protein YegP (UPF0339 family)
MTLPRRRWFGVSAGALALNLASRTAPAAAAAGMTFEIYADAKKEFRWRLKAGNGQVIATSGQGYKAKADCQHAIEIIQRDAAKAKVEDTTGGKA